MPPTRTVPPAKAVKTERTHEENQERAYIAASRRSDRSLEARVESARRASEIHKRRTGRSLRVTEQDVINEEMYEEEDDDLPLQYRRLTAHLQTGSADFNRRLSAYLTNQVAMRSALDYAMNNSYAQQQQYPNAPQFAHQQSMFPSPMMAHQQQQQQQMMVPPSPSFHRHAPYPSPRPQQGFQQPNQHQRSASIAVPQDASTTTQASPALDLNATRRVSLPTAPVTGENQNPAPTSKTSQVVKPSFPQGSFSQPAQSTPALTQAFIPPFDFPHFNNTPSYSPLSTALPQESQQLLGSTLDSSDHLTSLMMSCPFGGTPSYYNFSPSLPQTTPIGKHQPVMHPSYDGMNSTLAPSALELNHSNSDYSLTPNYFDQAMKAGGSPAGTPGVGDEPWANFIDTDQWEIPSGSQ